MSNCSFSFTIDYDQKQPRKLKQQSRRGFPARLKWYGLLKIDFSTIRPKG
jgi:hypothetical protein